MKTGNSAIAKILRLTGLVIALGALAGGPGQAQDTLARLKESGLKIGIAPEPPYSEIKPDGTAAGAEPEMTKIILQRLGVTKFSSDVVDWGALIPGLQAGRFDAVATGLFVRPQRCKAVSFSKPLLCTAEALLVKKGNPLGLKDYPSLKAKNARIAAVGGGAEEKRALDVGVPRDRVFGVSDIFNAFKLLETGRVDALGFPDLTLKEAMSKAGDSFELITPIEGEPIQCSAVAFKRQDRALRDQFDAQLDEIKKSGEYSRILVSYKFDPALSEKITRDQLCDGAN